MTDTYNKRNHNAREHVRNSDIPAAAESTACHDCPASQAGMRESITVIDSGLRQARLGSMLRTPLKRAAAAFNGERTRMRALRRHPDRPSRGRDRKALGSMPGGLFRSFGPTRNKPRQNPSDHRDDLGCQNRVKAPMAGFQAQMRGMQLSSDRSTFEVGRSIGDRSSFQPLRRGRPGTARPLYFI